jgi:hypothetical protein
LDMSYARMKWMALSLIILLITLLPTLIVVAGWCAGGSDCPVPHP